LNMVGLEISFYIKKKAHQSEPFTFVIN
jgi:hypothetical protein